MPVHYDDRVEIPVKVRNSQDVMAVELTVNYDAADFSVASVQETGLADDFSVAYNPVGGVLRIAMAGAMRFSGDGKIAKITLEKNRPGATTGGVSIAYARLNDVTVAIEGSQVERRADFALGPIAPNPFSDGTTVMFKMGTTAEVGIDIYNVNGQLVTTLVDATLPAGQHSAVWDGKDMRGERVARGVYFCRMTTADMVAIEKVVLMQ
jgi:hypothetical protein